MTGNTQMEQLEQLVSDARHLVGAYGGDNPIELDRILVQEFMPRMTQVLNTLSGWIHATAGSQQGDLLAKRASYEEDVGLASFSVFRTYLGKKENLTIQDKARAKDLRELALWYLTRSLNYRRDWDIYFHCGLLEMYAGRLARSTLAFSEALRLTQDSGDRSLIQQYLDDIQGGHAEVFPGF